MQKIEQITARGIPLLLDDIDTDRIIPARYLRCVTFEGLGEHAFEDDRKQDPKHPFDDPRFQGAGVLVVGRNFGCGSSREHAPQALMRWGIKAIVGESFAEIFFGNCTANGIPAVCASPDHLKKLADAVAADPQQTITVDLVANTVRCGSLSFPCTMQAGARQSLVTGNWDFLGQLVEAESEIRATAERLPYVSQFA
jgi:3-isopropylmalate/(R)-2-methylmalate dehydratase small subunit